MSISIGASTSAPSYQSLFSQQGVGGADSTDPLDELLQELAGPSDSSAQTAPADADAGGSGTPSSAFDPSSFTALLSAQEQSGGDSSSSSSASGSGGGGHVGGGDPTSQSDTSADGSTTETVTNPDGSMTTIVTNADGTTSETTTAAAPSINASSASGESDEDSAEGLQQLQAFLQPLATVAMAALL